MKTTNLAILLGPILLFIAIIFSNFNLTFEQKIVIGCTIWMLTWWISNITPLFITALLPVIIFPIFGVLNPIEISSNYSSPMIFLFMGGFAIAVAFQKHHLHKKIALNIVNLIGFNLNKIVLGFIVATALLSAFISNTATTIMMLPMTLAIINLLQEQLTAKQLQKFSTAILLAIAFAANVGGIATLIGTPPNIVLANFLQKNLNINISFVSWSLIAIPFVVLMLTIIYLIIKNFLIPKSDHCSAITKKFVQDQLRSLGKLTKVQKITLIIFFITASLWILRPIINTKITAFNLNDASISIAAMFALFTLPYSMSAKKPKFILTARDVLQIPWSILLLLGGAFVLANGFDKVNLFNQIEIFLNNYSHLNYYFIIFFLSLIMLLGTELISNVALTTLLIPICLTVAANFGIDPLLIAIPVTFAASCAFAMPIATPPNMIIYSTGKINPQTMFKIGVLLNIIALALIMIVVLPLIEIFK